MDCFALTFPLKYHTVECYIYCNYSEMFLLHFKQSFVILDFLGNAKTKL